MSIDPQAIPGPDVSPSAARRGVLLLVVFAAVWAVVEGVIGVRLHGHYNLLEVVWFRYATHLSLMCALWAWSRPKLLWSTPRPAFQLARSMLMLIMPLSFALAVQFGAPAELVWSVFWISPLLILFFARWLLGEWVPRSLWLVAALGSFTAAAMLVPAHVPVWPTLLLPVVMALSFSLYVVMTRMLRHEAVQTNLFYTAFGVFLALTPVMPFVWVSPTWHDAVVLAGIGVLGFVALLALDRSAESAPVSFAAPAVLAQVVCMSLIAWLLDGDPPSKRGLIGSVVIVGVIICLWLLQASQSGKSIHKVVHKGSAQ
jgi:drug/metabolite transporter (DMT)-like permease